MAFPMGAVTGSLAAICGSHVSSDFNKINTQYFEDLKKLEENRNAILEYLKSSFRADVKISEEYDVECTIYILEFQTINIGIRLDNTMIINADLETSYRYAYNLVWRELDKIKERYLLDKE